MTPWSCGLEHLLMLRQFLIIIRVIITVLQEFQKNQNYQKNIRLYHKIVMEQKEAIRMEIRSGHHTQVIM